jgi:hypothetical protein
MFSDVQHSHSRHGFLLAQSCCCQEDLGFQQLHRLHTCDVCAQGMKCLAGTPTHASTTVTGTILSAVQVLHATIARHSSLIYALLICRSCGSNSAQESSMQQHASARPGQLSSRTTWCTARCVCLPATSSCCASWSSWAGAFEMCTAGTCGCRQVLTGQPSMTSGCCGCSAGAA